MDFSGIGMKLSLGLIGYKSIDHEVVNSSFEKCGLLPMDYRFVNCRDEFSSMQMTKSGLSASNSPYARKNDISNVSVNKRLVTAEARQGEFQNLLVQVESIYETEQDPAARSEKLRVALDDNNRIQCVLRSNIADIRPTWNARGMQNGTFSLEVLTKATPALYLIHRQVIKIRKEKASASLVAAEARKREQEEKKAARELIKKERAAKLAKSCFVLKSGRQSKTQMPRRHGKRPLRRRSEV